MPFNLSNRRFVLLLVFCCYICEGLSQKVPLNKADLEGATSIKAKADICFDISDAYTNSLKIDSALYFANKVREYSEQINYETGFGKYYFALAEALYFRGRRNEAKEHVSKAIEIFTRQKETRFLGRSHIELASIQYADNKTLLARDNDRVAIDIFERLDDSKGLYSAYWWMAHTYFKTSETDSASFYSIKALSIAEKLNDPEKIFISACMLGWSFQRLGELDEAARYYDYGLKNRTTRVDKVGLRSFLSDYATCLFSIHDFLRADSVLKEVESVNILLRDDYGIAVINRLRGALEFEKKNYSQSIFYLQQAYNKMIELKILNSETKDILLQLGKAEYEVHDYENAITHLELAAMMAREFRQLMDEEEADLLISKSFQKKANADSALIYFEYHAALKDSLLSQQKQKNIIEITARYETEKKEQAIKMLEKEKEANSYLLSLQGQQLEKQRLIDDRKSQQLILLSQQNEISKLEASRKTLAFDNQEKEILKKQNELALLSKENELQATLAAKQVQRKNFAYIAIITVLLFSGYVFYRYLQNKRLSRRLSVSLTGLKEAQEQLIKTEKEKEADNIRIRISRDIHDEVGATLSGVALFSEIARQKMKQQRDADAQAYLDHITANSKEMVEKMSDIVWTINPVNDSFDRIIEKLQSYAINLCAGKGIRLHLDIDELARNYNPSMQVRKDIYLIMKEAINNAIKYSEGKNIFLSVQKDEDMITIKIRDDGIGFETKESYPGNGLNNMQARAKNIGAKFSIDSMKNDGTTIRLEFYFHPAGGQETVK